LIFYKENKSATLIFAKKKNLLYLKKYLLLSFTNCFDYFETQLRNKRLISQAFNKNSKQKYIKQQQKLDALFNELKKKL